MTKLTQRNYFTTKNQYLSNSKLKDYAKDKHYFYQKHVLGNIEQKKTDALFIGSAVDCWLTSGEKKFREKYYIVSRRTTNSPDYEFQLNQTMYDSVEKMCRKIESQTAYTQLRGFKAQQILQVDRKIGIFEGLCGIPDWFKVKDDHCIIVDLKTAENALQTKYHYKCLEYGYYQQQAMYRILVQANYPEVKIFEHRHLVVEKDPDGINNVFVYKLSEARVLEEVDEIEKLLLEIAEEKKFLPRNVSWDDVITIGEINEDF